LTAHMYRRLTRLSALVCLLLMYAIYRTRELPHLASLAHSPAWQSFKAIFLGIVLEGLPFILLGVLVSAVLHEYVSDKSLRRWIPDNPLLAILAASLFGIVFPVCECGMIPVVRRLMQKGLPPYAAVAFILAGPIINPVVFASTSIAFHGQPAMIYMRMGLAFAVSLTVALLIRRFVRFNPLKPETPRMHAHAHRHHDHDRGHLHEPYLHAPGRAESLHVHEPIHGHPSSRSSHRSALRAVSGSRRAAGWYRIAAHASDELFDMGKYFILGALIAALLQTWIARDSLEAVGHGWISSHLFMMGFAYLLSICSTSDAFVASSFAGTFSAGSLLAFLVFGPMLDLKGTLMLLSSFRTRFVLILAGWTAAAVLAGSVGLELLLSP